MVNFVAFESSVYLLNRPSSFLSLYGFKPDTVEREMEAIAKQLISVMDILHENPVVRYHRPHVQHDPMQRQSLSTRLAQYIQVELDCYSTLNKQFGNPDPTQPRPVLYVLDRGVDMHAALVHEFTYQAMANDLLYMPDGNRYMYSLYHIYMGIDTNSRHPTGKRISKSTRWMRATPYGHDTVTNTLQRSATI
jgi:syntaxin-binding protein 1